MAQPGTAVHETAQGLTPARQLAVLEGLPTALLLVDGDELVSFASKRAEDLLAVGSSSLVGCPVGEVLAPMARLREVAAGPARLDDRPSITIRGEDGAPREIGIQLSDIENGPAAATIVVFQEIGQLLRLRQERDHLLKLATVGDVLPTILHELKNPLASVTSAVELLVEEAPPGRFQDDLHAILTEVRRMKLGFEGIGVVGRSLQSRRHAAIDLALRNAVQVFHRRAQNEGIELECEIPDLALLRLDDSVVRALAFNILNNAFHACRRGDSIRVAARLDDEGHSFVFEIADTGCGMDAETLARCTSLFFTTKHNGSGIGLALCKSTLESAGGELEISSELGVGTTMIARIPLAGPN